jgi:mono/diheme cytochrome c family protein
MEQIGTENKDVSSLRSERKRYFGRNRLQQNATPGKDPRRADVAKCRGMSYQKKILTRYCLILVVGLMNSSANAADLPLPAQRRVDYDRDVRPLLVKHCYACHGPEKQKGGLRLDRKADALKGGDDGAVLIVGKSAKSDLILRVAGVDEDRVMPPKGERLSADQIGIFRAWIDQGADWPGDDSGDRRDWWSLRPLNRPLPPKLSAEDETRARNPVDRFVLAKLREKRLSPSAEADRRTLIRRLYFDLIGLPPTPEEIEAFLQDSSADAYERLVDRLLDSPHFGERWARHWLDVVHYGDTHGYDKDQPRPNAWPYRDYVIRAFNSDVPYGRFIQEQIAGDVLYPGTQDGVTALGFIAAGPWDLIGHAEVPESKIDGKVARHLDRDDMVANTINTFASLTIQCAQCHNHKFDPILQEDYYRLQAVFAALDRADRPYFTDPAAAKHYAELISKQTELRRREKALDAKMKQLGGAELDELDRKIVAAGKPGMMKPEFGYHSQIEAKQDRVKWVQVDLGRSIALDRIVLWGCHDDFNNIGDGFGFPVRFKIELADDAEFKHGVVVVADRTSADVPNPRVAAQSFPAKGAKGRFVRVTATKLALRQNDYIFALSELEAFDAAGKNVTLGATVTALDSIEAPVRWRKSNLTDGYAPGQLDKADLVKLKNERETLIARVVGPDASKARAGIAAELTANNLEIAKVPPTGLVYAGTIHDGASAAFRGTGPDGGKPRPIFVLKRGNVQEPIKEVGPGAPPIIAGLSGEFILPANHREGDRRAALAKWLIDPKNPLTWRSIVNRVWQYHFGRGIVTTANDLGHMGQLPTHPELLDWLAVEFRDGGQSLKSLHRLIVTSATYRQASASSEALEKLDADNAYLWRMNRRKLDAEAIRDAALAVSGKLDRTMDGPAFQDFKVEHPEHSPHYEYGLADPDDPKARRRSIYRFLVRSKPQPFMTVLDCADPSMQVDKRSETLSPLQALSLFNNGFMLAQAKHLAERVKDAGGMVAAFRLALGRKPTAAEREALEKYAREHGLANACRVILNLNEFVFVD